MNCVVLHNTIHTTCVNDNDVDASFVFVCFVCFTCNLQSNHCRVANFIIEITNMHIYDFGPKAMLSNAGL